jgi:predicted chitinase/peptidoglycan hydrolase-like protein with peptidoglycan-binding domain
MSILLSEADLRRVFPHADPEIMASVAGEWDDTLSRYHINDTKNRLLFFMAQTGEETGGWRSMVENGHFSDDRDRYRGRGLIQLTLRSNYQQIGAKLARDFPDSGLNFDLVNHPDLVAEPAYVLKTAAAWWDANGINSISDTGDFLRVSRRVNGTNPSTGLPNGWPQRQMELVRISKLLASVLGSQNASPASQDTAIPSMVLDLGASGPQIKAMQTTLKDAGYDVGAVDGIYGTLTRAALLAFQADNNIPTTGIVDAETNVAFSRAKSRPLTNQRVAATANDLAKLGSRTVINGQRANILGWLATVFGGLGLTNSAINPTKATGAASDTAATTAATTAANLSDAISTAREQVQSLITTPPAPLNVPNLRQSLQKVVDSLDALRQSSGQLQNLDFSDLLNKLQATLGMNPVPIKSAQDVANALQHAAATLPHTAPGLPAGGAETVSSALSALGPLIGTAANAVLPGAGGALVTVAIGLATSLFSNRAVQARVDDHRSGSNVDL